VISLLARRRRSVPTWIFACATLVATAVAVAGVSMLRDRADEARRNQLVLQ
jgi:type VI protein secretion system component VasF